MSLLRITEDILDKMNEINCPNKSWNYDVSSQNYRRCPFKKYENKAAFTKTSDNE